jgi:hypothetical protein
VLKGQDWDTYMKEYQEYLQYAEAHPGTSRQRDSSVADLSVQMLCCKRAPSVTFWLRR